MNSITSGTREWATSNVNIAEGCLNNCHYCYAKKMAIRFGRKTNETWKYMQLKEKNVHKSYGKRKGRIMFPTSHDIVPEILDECVIVLKKLLEAKNKVLITTKPNFDCIVRLCRELKKYKDQILFRFTITSLSDTILAKYEPNAPKIGERIQSLKHAKLWGFKTSISIEPFLDMNPLGLILVLFPDVTDTIWIGKLNYEKKVFNTTKNCRNIIRNIEQLPEKYKKKIRLKDSLKKIKEKYES